MSTNATTTSTVRREEGTKKRRKGVIGIAAMATAGALVLGLGYAYFGDTVFGSGSATAGSLDIEGSFAAVYNDNNGTSSAANVNPGDVITIGGNVVNEGNKSAWIRTSVDLSASDATIAPELYVFSGDVAQSDLLGKSDTDLKARTDFLGVGEAAVHASTPVILDGSGTAAETETATGALKSSTYDGAVTIYFDSDAGNGTQLDGLGWKVTIDAVQYRNNTTVGSVNWADAVAVDSVASAG